ncbi:uncharacterized protein [Musca autumnalis]|uniref:uncharacterized protein n=1 Tax=Musca autumnalis TaxID=221902 RepID=UPI003CFB76A0
MFRLLSLILLFCVVVARGKSAYIKCPSIGALINGQCKKPPNNFVTEVEASQLEMDITQAQRDKGNLMPLTTPARETSVELANQTSLNKRSKMFPHLRLSSTNPWSNNNFFGDLFNKETNIDAKYNSRENGTEKGKNSGEYNAVKRTSITEFLSNNWQKRSRQQQVDPTLAALQIYNKHPGDKSSLNDFKSTAKVEQIPKGYDINFRNLNMNKQPNNPSEITSVLLPTISPSKVSKMTESIIYGERRTKAIARVIVLLIVLLGGFVVRMWRKSPPSCRKDRSHVTLDSSN